MVGRIYGLVCPIENIVRYIGQTTLTIEERFNHHFRDRVQLKNKTNHKSSWMNKLWNEHGLKPTLILIEEIEDCTDEILNVREKFWIKNYLNEGNDLTNTSGKDFFRVHRKNCSKGKKIYCYDKNYNLQIFKNAREGNKILDISYKIISQVANLAGKSTKYCFSFIELDEEYLKNYFNFKHRSEEVVAKNIITGEETEFSSQFVAAKELKINFRNINLVLKEQRHTAGKHYWKYKSDNEFRINCKKSTNHSKSVLSLENNMTFSSILSCAKFYNTEKNNIIYNIRYGKIKKFKFINE